MTETKGISQKSFNQIKTFAKFLIQAAQAEPEGNELESLPGDLEAEAEDTFPYNESLGEYMNENNDLFYAGNLNIYHGYSAISAYTRDEDIANPDDEPLDYKELSIILNKLVKLGRTGIYKLEVRNKHLSRKIYKLEDKMNIID